MSTTTRDQVYSFANDLAKKALKEGLPHDSLAIEPGSGEDDYLHGLLNKVEDDRAHREAEKLRVKANGVAAHGSDLVVKAMAGATRAAADVIDPYEMRDGQLFRKSDGKPVIL